VVEAPALRLNRTWPLVGREEELALIADAIASTHVNAVLVSGNAGVGKSRVVAEALAAADRGGLATERVLATEAAAAIPFGAFAFQGPGQARPEDGRMGVIREASAAIVEQAAGRRLILGVDDVDHLDDASAALIHHMAETRAAFVVACVRSDRPAADAVAKLWSGALAERVELPPLSRAQTDELLEAALGSPVGGDTRQRVWKATKGNPLYVRELVLGATEAGSLVERDRVWRWTGSVDEGRRLTGLLDERLGTLTAEELQALELVAIAEPIPVDVLAALAGEDVLAATERRGLLDVSKEGNAWLVRLSHPLYGEVLRARAPKIGAREMKRRLAEAFEGDPGLRAEDSLRIATWRVESGTTHDADALVVASRQAIAAFDMPLAAELARAAVEADGGWASEQVLAEAMIGQGWFEVADARLEAARRLCTNDLEIVLNAITRANNLFWHLGRDRTAMAVIEEAEGAAEADALRNAMTATRAGFLLFDGRTEPAIELASSLIDGADVWDYSTWQAAMAAGWGLACAGGLERSLQLVDLALEQEPPVPALAPPSSDAWLRVSRFTTLSFEGKFEAGLAEGRAVYDDAVESGSGTARAMASFGLGWSALLQGTPETAARWLREAVSQLREVDMFGQLSSVLGELAQAEALLGNLDAAESALRDAESARVACSRLDECPVGLGRTWVAAAQGKTSAAVSHALDTARATGGLGHRYFQAIALHDALRLGEATVVGELVALGELVDGDLMAAFVEHGLALRSGDAQSLAETSLRFERLGASLCAAEASAEAASTFQAEGRADSARAAAARSTKLRGLCEGAMTPALADLEEPSLSRREREVATLAARGLSNAEIAEQLVLSVRTVENHLHNGYAKLGVGAREDLAPLLGAE
jgi:DNA-binding CsgD family transcriptional regulator